MNEDEEWAAVLEFPDQYEISTLGRLRRINPYRQNHADKIRTPQKTKKGYVVYMLSVNCKPYLRSAHRMVADAFLGPIPEGMQVNHKNGQKDDPRLSNLEIVTNSENRTHSYRVLKVAPNRGKLGTANHNAKLSWNEVVEIRRMYSAKELGMGALASKFGVSKQTVFSIVHNKHRLTT